MKRTLLTLLVVIAAVASASQSRLINSHNWANAKASPASSASANKIKTVAIVISDGPTIVKQIVPIPDPVKLTLKDKIHWVVIDTREAGPAIESVSVDTLVNKQTNILDNPFGNDSGLTFDSINLRDLDASKITSEAVKTGTFKYNITIKFAGQNEPVVLDPEISIGG